MKIKLLTAAALLLGNIATAQAYVKLAEFGDPDIGNSYGGCTFTKNYGTGGSGFLYDQYLITCPSGTYQVGVYKSTLSFPCYQCTFYPASNTYFVEGTCDNWRVYRN